MKTTHTSGQLANFLTLLEQKGIAPEDFQRRLESGVLADVFDLKADLSDRSLWRGAFKLGSLDGFPITVDYSQSLVAMIAAGHYDWKNDDITAEHFPVKGEGAVNIEIQLVHLNCTMESDDILRELNTMGLRPATIEELLAFGAKYPDIQIEFPIVALGSVWRHVDGYRRVPCLFRHGAERGLLLYWFEGRWSGYCRFVAVRK